MLFMTMEIFFSARSPVFTHLNATLNGLTTIRAYCAQDILKQEFDKLQDVHTSTVYMYIVTSTAFGFTLDIFCFIFISLITFSFLLFNQCKHQFSLINLRSSSTNYGALFIKFWFNSILELSLLILEIFNNSLIILKELFNLSENHSILSSMMKNFCLLK